MRHLLNVLFLGALAIVAAACDASEPERAPRCPPNVDIACLPVPYRDGVYDPNGARHVVVSESPQVNALSHGACRQDGECLLGGCGSDCEAYTEPVHANICPAYPELFSAFCGCVDQRCTWFTQ